MPRTPAAKINPALLAWARRSIGLSVEEAARKIQTSVEKLQSWEAGETRPTIAQLRKAANAYKRPLGVFYLPEPPLDFMPLADFRRLPEVEAGLSTGLLLEIRRAQEQRELHLELLEDLEDSPEAPVRVSLRIQDDPEDAARNLRDLVGVDLNEQFSWRDPYEALNAWIAALEDLGYLVMQTSGVDLDEMRGFSIFADRLPLAVLNGSDAPNGRIFTLMHELTHLQLAESGVCDLHERGSRLTDAIEIFCNQVSAAVLMPQSAFLAESSVRWNRGDEFWNDESVGPLARKYSVSREAVLRRLLTFDRISESFYRQRRSELLESYQRTRQESAGFAPVASIRVRDLGRSYVRTVVSAYRQRQITAADLSRLLGARLKHLPRIEAAVGRDG